MPKLRERLRNLVRVGSRQSRAVPGSSAATPSSNLGDCLNVPATWEPEVAEISTGVGPLILFDKAKSRSTGHDIVFVHGLRGCRLRTWSMQDGFCWPRELLGEDLEDTRVITWGYDASIAKFFQQASQEGIFGHAGTLLDDLARVRVGIARPIIFVCHSLGGLVVKEALIKADAYSAHQRHHSLGAIRRDTVGVIFLGTPHRGSDQETYGEVVAKIAKLALRQPNEQLLQTLSPDSHILDNQRDQFTTISKDLRIFCVREELSTAIGMIVPVRSAVYDGFNVRQGTIHANHMDMARFGTRSSGYDRILGYIRELCPLQTGASKKVKLILMELDPGGSLLGPSIDAPYSDTCTWVFDASSSGKEGQQDSLDFMSWLRNSDSSQCWISGKAASGKSTLMKFIFASSEVDLALKEWAGAETLLKVGHFFFERGSDLQKSREGILRNALYQILEKRNDLVPLAFSDTFKHLEVDLGVSKTVAAFPRHLFDDWKFLNDAFFATLGGLQNSKVCLFIDGLDEYRMINKLENYTQEQLDLLHDGTNEDEAWGNSEWLIDGHREIAEFILKLSHHPNAKVCFSSRELTVFERLFQHHPRLQVHHHTAPAIKMYCQDRLQKEAPDLDEASKFAAAVTEKACGVFLWVNLVIGMLVSGNDRGDNEAELWEILEMVPGRLGGENGLYMHMMKNVAKQDLDEAARLFQLVIYRNSSIRSLLHLDIITLFLAAEGHLQDGTEDNRPLRIANDQADFKTWEELRPQWKARQRRLKSRCAGLLEGAEDVQFMHQTAKEFLSRDRWWLRIFGPQRGFSSIGQTYLAMISGCIRRLKRCKEATVTMDTVKGALEPESERLRSELWYPNRAISLLATCFELCMDTPLQHQAEELQYLGLIAALEVTGGETILDEPELTTDRDTKNGTWTQSVCSYISYMDPGVIPGPMNMLELATALNLELYVIPNLRGPARFSKAQLARLLVISSLERRVALRFGVRESYVISHVSPTPALIQALFSAGADANFPLLNAYPGQTYLQKSPWAQLLANDEKTSDLESIVDIFLQHGADLSGATSGGRLVVDKFASQRWGTRKYRVEEGSGFRTTRGEVAQILGRYLAAQGRELDKNAFPHCAALLDSEPEPDSNMG
ncbi:hypothetical protein QBC44DRAFT_331101 [Cladorrhinum sp. PSN332]|nr:hypothetical protein QBC44DRAFT_331101 [Cladorrhinum sp. PSN332]